MLAQTPPNLCSSSSPQPLAAASAGSASALNRGSSLSWHQLVYKDYRRYICSDETFFRTVFCCQGFWATFVYRIARAIVLSAKPAIFRRLLRAALSIIQKFVEILTTGISIPPECEIGEGLYIGHHGTTILPARGSLGRNCNLGHGVTIGLAGSGEKRGAPRIGNRVFIGTHAVIVGKITIGDDAMICAGSVLTRSIPPRAVAIGNPARVVSFDGAFDHVIYDGMEQDPERQASLALRGQLGKTDPTAGVL